MHALMIFLFSKRGFVLRGVSGRYWTLTFGANWLYGEELGYDVRYLPPKLEHDEYGARKIGWAKVTERARSRQGSSMKIE